MMSARDGLLSLIDGRLESAYLRGDEEQIQILESMRAKYGCL